MQLLHSGKVREVYLDGDDIVLVASDRVSVYDVVLPTPIPDKGALLTQLSLWWFGRVDQLVPHHVLSATDVPAEFAGRALRCRRLDMLPVECIVRGYVAGLGLREYRQHGSISGVQLPPGLVEGSELPEPVFTPTTKAAAGAHDEFLTFADVVDLVGSETAEQLRETSLALYRYAAPLARQRGILLADTKLEFGRAPDGTLTLADEVFTPDSSRFWPADSWRPGGAQRSFDKQFVRDWAAGTGWDATPPAPEIPATIVEATRQRYAEAYERLTGDSWRTGRTG